MRKRISLDDLQHIDARRICVIKPSALGDVVQALPLLSVLRERFPQATIAWVIAKELHNLLDGHPHLDTLIDFRRRGSWRDGWQLLRQLRQQRFDLVFDLQGLARTGVMTFATGARCRIGLETAREAAHLACHRTLPGTSKNVAAHERYWRVAEALGLGDRERRTIIPIADADRAWVRNRLCKLSGTAQAVGSTCSDKGLPILAVHPGAKWVTKRWPPDRFGMVAARSFEEFGTAVVLVGSPGERELADAVERRVMELAPSAPVLNLAGQTTLKQLAALLEYAAIALTNDSGPMHLAAGLGTPVVAAFTCTDPARSAPAGSAHAFVRTRVACAGSYKKTCPYRGAEHLACLDELDADRVWREFQRVMARIHGRSAVA